MISTQNLVPKWNNTVFQNMIACNHILLIFNNNGKKSHHEDSIFGDNYILENQMCTCRRIKLVTYEDEKKIKSKWMKDINLKPET